jgi:hypothetical protein
MVMLLMTSVRRVSESEAQRVVSHELGDEVGQTVRVIREEVTGMSYLTWRVGDVWYNLGTSSEPYVPAASAGQAHCADPAAGHVKPTMRLESGPQDLISFEAWISHRAWLYIDSLAWYTEAEAAELHLRNVLRVASHFIDERCVLIWQWGTDRFAKPTPQAVASLRAGQWPG